MKKLRLAWNILKKMNVDKILICSFILTKCESQIDTVWDGLWYCFVSFTTIGFGDIVAQSLIGKIITILVACCGIILVAIITGVLVTYYQEVNKIKLKESTEMFLNKLEHLPELSKEQLKELSNKIKARKFKL